MCQWGKTYWFGRYVAKENIYGWVYLVFRAGSGAMLCDVEFIDRQYARCMTHVTSISRTT